MHAKMEILPFAGHEIASNLKAIDTQSTVLLLQSSVYGPEKNSTCTKDLT